MRDRRGTWALIHYIHRAQVLGCSSETPKDIFSPDFPYSAITAMETQFFRWNYGMGSSPECRVICSLRDPVARVYSQYKAWSDSETVRLCQSAHGA